MTENDTCSDVIDRLRCHFFGHVTERYMPEPNLAKWRCTRCGDSGVNWDARSMDTDTEQ